MMCIKLPHTILHPFFHGKKSKNECSKAFSGLKTPKGGYVKGVMEEGGAFEDSNSCT